MAALVNSVNPTRIAGQASAAYEICDELGRAPDVHCLPVGNAGNITAYWAGYRAYLRRRADRRAAADVRLPGRRRRAAGARRAGAPPGDDRHRDPDRRARRPGRRAITARDESGGRFAAVTDDEILAAYRLLSAREAVFVEPASAASVAGLLQSAADGTLPRGSLVVCTVTGHGLKDPDTALLTAPDADRGADRPGRGRRRAGAALMGAMADREVRVRVPGSSANLGPGFDTLGLALGLYDEVEVSVAADGVDGRGDGRGRRPGALRRRAPRRPGDAHAPGTSSATRRPASGCAAATRSRTRAGWAAPRPPRSPARWPPWRSPGATPELERDTLLQVTAGMEGHADNAAASLLGGFVVAWETAREYRASGSTLYDSTRTRASARWRSSRDVESSTSTTRGLLPDRVPLADAAFTGSRTALAVLAFTQRPDLLLPATEDRLHQGYRRPAYPESADLVDALRAARRAGRDLRRRTDRARADRRRRRCPPDWTCTGSPRCRCRSTPPASPVEIG